MRHQSLASLVVPAVLVAMVSFAGPPAAGQSGSTTASTNKWTAPRTPDGHPDLQGIWDYATMVPFERPTEFAGKSVLTNEEAAEFEGRVQRRLEEGNFTTQMPSGTYNLFWREPGKMSTRTSLIVDPPDGRVPYQPQAQNRGPEGRTFDSHEDRPLSERCILWATAGPPMVPGPYNSNAQIVQTRDHVVILNEMIHEHRIVPLDGRPHLDGSIRQWLGDSVGRWEGEALVIETTNFTDRTSFRGASEKMQLVERFTRVEADTLLYEFTVTDPASFTRPWTAQIPMARSAGPLYEYACHEGNYAMPNGLGGSRNLERAAGGALR